MPHVRKVPVSEHPAIAEAHRAGASLKVLGHQYGVTASSIGRIARAAGAPKRVTGTKGRVKKPPGWFGQGFRSDLYGRPGDVASDPGL